MSLKSDLVYITECVLADLDTLVTKKAINKGAIARTIRIANVGINRIMIDKFTKEDMARCGSVQDVVFKYEGSIVDFAQETLDTFSAKFYPNRPKICIRTDIMD